MQTGPVPASTPPAWRKKQLYPHALITPIPVLSSLHGAFDCCAARDPDRTTRVVGPLVVPSVLHRRCLTGPPACAQVFVTSTARTLDLATALVNEKSILVLTSAAMKQPLLERLNKFIFPADQVEASEGRGQGPPGRMLFGRHGCIVAVARQSPHTARQVLLRRKPRRLHMRN